MASFDVVLTVLVFGVRNHITLEDRFDRSITVVEIGPVPDDSVQMLVQEVMRTLQSFV